MDHRHKCKTQNCKTHRKQHRIKLGDTGFGNNFLCLTPKASPTTKRTGYAGLHLN